MVELFYRMSIEKALACGPPHALPKLMITQEFAESLSERVRVLARDKESVFAVGD